MPLPASCCRFSSSPGISPRVSGILAGVPLPLVSRRLPSLPRPTPPRSPYSQDSANSPKKSATTLSRQPDPIGVGLAREGSPFIPQGINTLLDHVARPRPVDRRGTT